MEISVVGPAYNESKNLPIFLERTTKALNKLKKKHEIIIVNDASSDNSIQTLKNLKKKHKNLVVFTHTRNQGLTAAMWTGFTAAKGKLIIMLPTDLESNPTTDISLLLKKQKQGYDMVVGNRVNRRQGASKYIFSKLFNTTARLLFGVKLNDLGWIKIFRREILEDIEPFRADWHRFFAILVASKGYKVGEVPVRFHSRIHGKSSFGRMGIMRAWGGFVDMLTIKFNTLFSQKPMRFFGALGCISIALGTSSGLYLTFLKITEGTIEQHIPLLFLTIMLVIVGIQVLTLGILAEYLASILNYIRNK
jgi:glycosyltransferase involved in cell wall biosynthesis